MRDFLGEKGQLWANCSFPLLKSKGAVASYLKIPTMEPIVFICAHLPFDADSLKQSYLNKNPKIREKSISYCNLSFNYLLQELVFNVQLGTKVKPMDVSHVFFFGDLNYRVFSMEPDFENAFLPSNTEIFSRIWKENDELYQELKKGRILIDFKEGVDNKGPLFLPTCKMKKPRQEIEQATCIADIFNIGQGQRKPSWCDRILFYDLKDGILKTKCLEYDRLDSGETMKKSDHAAIYGLYIINNN